MKPPLWYTATEIKNWLGKVGYPNKSDWPAFFAKHFQLAFEKGWSKCLASEPTVEDGQANVCAHKEAFFVDRSGQFCTSCGMYLPPAA